MSQYKILDEAIMKKIGGHPQMFVEIFVRDVREECHRIADATGCQAYRILDRRLQALRKAGKIRFISKGWIRVPSATASKDKP